MTGRSRCGCRPGCGQRGGAGCRRAPGGGREPAGADLDVPKTPPAAPRERHRGGSRARRAPHHDHPRGADSTGEWLPVETHGYAARGPPEGLDGCASTGRAFVGGRERAGRGPGPPRGKRGGARSERERVEVLGRPREKRCGGVLTGRSWTPIIVMTIAVADTIPGAAHTQDGPGHPLETK